MNENLMLLIAGVAGMVLGIFFFGGLWWTVRKGVTSKRPALWFMGSSLLRMSITVAGFYIIGQGQWRRLVACLLGFVAARLIVLRLTRLPVEKQKSPAQEASHAP